MRSQLQLSDAVRTYSVEAISKTVIFTWDSFLFVFRKIYLMGVCLLQDKIKCFCDSVLWCNDDSFSPLEVSTVSELVQVLSLSCEHL